MRYRLRTLLILMAVGPPAIWAAWIASAPAIAAGQRALAQDWIALLLVAVAIAVSTLELKRRRATGLL